MPNELITKLRAEHSKKFRSTICVNVMDGTANVLAITSERACCVWSTLAGDEVNPHTPRIVVGHYEGILGSAGRWLGERTSEIG